MSRMSVPIPDNNLNNSHDPTDGTASGSSILEMRTNIDLQGQMRRIEELVDRLDLIVARIEKVADRLFGLPTPVGTGSETPSSYRSEDTDASDKTDNSDSYLGSSDETRDETGDSEGEEAIAIPHHFVDADEAAASSLRYGRIPWEHLANPEKYSNQYFEVKKSRLGGNGAFAKMDLKKGQLILAELPIITATPMTLYRDIESLAPEIRGAFYRMHGHQRSPQHDMRQAICLTNAFSIQESSAIYLVAARFNHACGNAKSIKYRIIQDNIIEFRMAKDVPAGTELTISYGRHSPSVLYTLWGFRCACGGCKPLTDAQIERLDRRDDDNEIAW
ncbi:hypothetical protein F5Y11DRAFT_324291 [Daldinia sp. FL1419]|nr:hypothetical protein F5Y11DRAFT_324291 [Daldinia sp. FL1419]